MDEQDKIEKVAKEFGEIIVTKKIKERITYCRLMKCLKREKIEEEIDIKVIKKNKKFLKKAGFKLAFLFLSGTIEI